MKEFFIISNIYRSMNNILKNKLKQHNIPINETQLNILFLLYTKEKDISGDELLKAGNFALSSLLFNMHNLQNNNLIDSKDYITQYNLKNNINLSENGQEMLTKIDKLCINFYKNTTTNTFYETLISYEKEIKNNIKNNIK